MCTLCLASLFNIILFIYVVANHTSIDHFKAFFVSLLCTINFVRSEFIHIPIVALLSFLELYFLMCFRLLIFKGILRESFCFFIFPFLSSSGVGMLLPSPNSPGSSPEPRLTGLFQHTSSAKKLGLSCLRAFRRLGSGVVHEALAIHLPAYVPIFLETVTPSSKGAPFLRPLERRTTSLQLLASCKEPDSRLYLV